MPLLCHNELHCLAALTQLHGKVKSVRMAQQDIVIYCDATMADCAGEYMTISSIAHFQAFDFNQSDARILYEV